MEFDEVWFAAEERFRSKSKLMVYDDIGRLVWGGDTASFVGGTQHLTLHELEAPALASPMWNTTAYAWGTVAYLVFLAGCYFFFEVAGKGWVVWLFIAFIPLWYLTGYLMARSKWIQLTGTLENGQRVSLYFADGGGPMPGWRGIFGGTRQMFDSLGRA